MEILEHVKSILETVEHPIVIECGACDGYHSNLLLGIIKSKDRPYVFHTFEPSLEKFDIIKNNLSAHLTFNNGVIGLFPNAVGDIDGEVIFYESYGQKIKGRQVLDNYYGSSSVRKPTDAMIASFEGMKFREKKVDCVRLDTHIETKGLKESVIDFIWADVQGNENSLINGGEETFKNVRYFYTEYSNHEDYEGQTDLQGILNLLPYFEIVEDYGGDVLLKNKKFA